MKNVQILLLFVIPILFASCMDTREELEIKKDGSGTLQVKTDLSKIFELMKSFPDSDSSLQKKGFDKAMDTVMLMKDYVDTASAVPASQKELLRNGKVHVVLNAKEGIGKFDMNFPFTSTDKLQQLYASLNNSSGGLAGLFNGAAKNMQPGPDQPSEDKSMPQIATVYDIVVKNGLYSRKVNKERYDQFKQSANIDQLEGLKGMLGEMNYTLSVKLPGAVKRVSNSKAVISTDKKTVTLVVDLMDTFQHPELLSLEIEY
jgi:hypothetical protein